MLPHLGGDDLLIMDRGFPAVWLFTLLQQRSIPFLARLDGTQWPCVERFLRSGQTDMTVTLQVSQAARRQAQATGRQLIDQAVTFRLIRVLLPTGTVEVLTTSLLDSQAFPAEDFQSLYHARWNIEIFRHHRTIALLGIWHKTTLPNVDEFVLKLWHGAWSNQEAL